MGQKQRCERQCLLTPNEMPEPLTRTRLRREVTLGVTRADNKIWKTNKINYYDYPERMWRRMFL